MPVDFYYHSQSSPSCIVWMVLKELEIPYTGHVVNLEAGKHKEDDFKKLNPHMQVPVIKDGDFVLTQSRAIVMYLCKKYEKADKKDKLLPTDGADLAKFMALTFRDVDNRVTIGKYLNADAVFTGQAKGMNEAVLPSVTAILAEYEALLSSNDYIFGNHLTLLDYFYAHTIGGLALAKFDKWDDYPKLKAWNGRLQKLPYYEECMKQPIEKNKEFFQDMLKNGPPAWLVEMQKK